MNIIGLLGQAGTGKDTIAEMIAPVHLVKVDGAFIDIRAALGVKPASGGVLRSNAIQIALADPIKESALETYDFSLTQLWGPSAERNRPDSRYPRRLRHADFDVDGKCGLCGLRNSETHCPTSFLTPREVLQRLGTEVARSCYPNTWIDLALRRAAQLTTRSVRGVEHGKWVVSQPDLVIISDARFLNEAAAFGEAGHQVWRVTRNIDTRAAMYTHASELEQVTEAAAIAPYLTDAIANEGSLGELASAVEAALGKAGL